MSTSQDVQEFLRDNMDQEKFDKLDSEAGLYFLGYETASLAFALLQLEGNAWQVNSSRKKMAMRRSRAKLTGWAL